MAWRPLLRCWKQSRFWRGSNGRGPAKDRSRSGTTGARHARPLRLQRRCIPDLPRHQPHAKPSRTRLPSGRKAGPTNGKRRRKMSQAIKVKFAIQGAIARITLDRPEKLNALDPEMLAALENAVSEAEQSREVRVIILAAAGEKAFCVGADILAWTALSPLDMWSEWVRRGHRVFERLERGKQTGIFGIQGFAYGGGL